jgi:SWI/SNF-related matrix-associated actin-dependent regulator of chromatin subfamily A member 5
VLQLTCLLLNILHINFFRNPQADLQAQDRAHRIGQKKPVQVFRLVTDETVEVKVVERAQQKLKLDAMVVQQGRLQEKEKKMTKQDLLDTLRFGADKIFRSKDSTISDADIDLILEEGRKRTDEMNEKIQTADKGDIYDFKLDGGMATQVFEGKDYSTKQAREAEMMAMAGFFIDPGKRERKNANYSETVTRAPADDDKRQKLPRHLRLNKMEDWQFFDKARLTELQAEEIRLFDALVERGEAPQAGNIGKFVMLPPDLHEEKTQLLAAGFGDWTRVHFNNFVRASAKHGRHEFEKIAKDVGRPVEETRRYSQVLFFRSSGVTVFSSVVNGLSRSVAYLFSAVEVVFICNVVCYNISSFSEFSLHVQYNRPSVSVSRLSIGFLGARCGGASPRGLGAHHQADREGACAVRDCVLRD